jgi:amino acid transporter
MTSLLAYAEPTDTSGSGTNIVLLCALFIAVVAVLGLLPIGFSRNRGNRHADIITAVSVLWSLLTIATLIYVCLAQMKWSKEYITRIQSGYFDPRDTTGAPHQPWPIWGIILFAYLALLAWSLKQRKLPLASRLPEPPAK